MDIPYAKASHREGKNSKSRIFILKYCGTIYTLDATNNYHIIHNQFFKMKHKIVLYTYTYLYSVTSTDIHNIYIYKIVLYMLLPVIPF